MGVELVSIGTLGAEASTRNRRIWIAFDGDQLSILVINELAASYSAVGTHGTSNLGVEIARLQMAGSFRHCFGSSSVRTISDLLHQWPA